jgi:photosystem II stability/assembly factor-like uncharacterized protein
MKEELLNLNSHAFIPPPSAFRTDLSSLIRYPLTLIVLLVVCAACVQAAGVWTRQQSGTMAWLHAAYFLDQNRGWAVGSNGTLLATVNGGETWTTMKRPTEDALHDIYFSDEKTGWLVCERSVYLLRTKDEQRTYLMSTTDGGASWKRVQLSGSDADARLVRALFTTREHGWVFGEAGALYMTRDGGKNWLRQRSPTRYLLLGGASVDADRIWLVGAGATILQTSDGGATWRTGSLIGANDAATASARVRLNAVSFVEPRIGWAVGTGGRIFNTLDGGRTWRAQASNVTADLFDVKFLNASEGWAVGAEGTLIHTTDSGIHWQAVESGTTHPLERLFFSGRERGWAVGFGGTILAYTPGGPQSPKAPKLKAQR